MRVLIAVDSATPEEIMALTFAFQRTRAMGLPNQITTEPTVTAAGITMGWKAPALGLDRAMAILEDFNAGGKP